MKRVQVEQMEERETRDVNNEVWSATFLSVQLDKRAEDIESSEHS